MTLNVLLIIVGVTLGVSAIGGIAVFLWAACALSGRLDEEQGYD